ncbi:MAG: dihydroneopterin aldolase [Gemmatimonadetes bacterium]|nr:dihydroneopterin aldolase [Gemmatimonadota bacterium]
MRPGAPDVDRIIIPGIPLRAHVGWTAAEREAEQEISVHLELRLDLRPAGASDELAHTLDYDDVCERVAVLVRSKDFRLIEAVAESCARGLLADFSGVDEVRVEVRKPGALSSRGVPYAAVEVTRRRG